MFSAAKKKCIQKILIPFASDTKSKVLKIIELQELTTTPESSQRRSNNQPALDVNSTLGGCRQRRGEMLKSRIEIDPRYGRSLITTEPVAKGQVVVDELPFAYGPKQNSGIVCLGCYIPLQFGEDGDSLDRCDTCDWPLCSSCLESPVHEGECRIFSESHVRFAGNVGEDGICAQLDCITPLRLVHVISILLTSSNR